MIGQVDVRIAMLDQDQDMFGKPMAFAIDHRDASSRNDESHWSEPRCRL